MSLLHLLKLILYLLVLHNYCSSRCWSGTCWLRFCFRKNCLSIPSAGELCRLWIIFIFFPCTFTYSLSFSLSYIISCGLINRKISTFNKGTKSHCSSWCYTSSRCRSSTCWWRFCFGEYYFSIPTTCKCSILWISFIFLPCWITCFNRTWFRCICLCLCSPIITGHCKSCKRSYSSRRNWSTICCSNYLCSFSRINNCTIELTENCLVSRCIDFYFFTIRNWFSTDLIQGFIIDEYFQYRNITNPCKD